VDGIFIRGTSRKDGYGIARIADPVYSQDVADFKVQIDTIFVVYATSTTTDSNSLKKNAEKFLSTTSSVGDATQSNLATALVDLTSNLRGKISESWFEKRGKVWRSSAFDVERFLREGDFDADGKLSQVEFQQICLRKGDVLQSAARKIKARAKAVFEQSAGGTISNKLNPLVDGELKETLKFLTANLHTDSEQRLWADKKTAAEWDASSPSSSGGSNNYMTDLLAEVDSDFDNLVSLDEFLVLVENRVDEKTAILKRAEKAFSVAAGSLDNNLTTSVHVQQALLRTTTNLTGILAGAWLDLSGTAWFVFHNKFFLPPYE